MRMPVDIETLPTNFATTFTWDYGHHDAGLEILHDEDLETSHGAVLAAEPAAVA